MIRSGRSGGNAQVEAYVQTEEREDFGKTLRGKDVSLYKIAGGGLQASLTDLGAALVSLIVSDRDGNRRDVVLGYDNPISYEKGTALYGATIGRVSGRIEHAEFTLNGRAFHLDANEGGNCCHSGFNGYQKRIWDTKEVSDSQVTFTIKSPDGDQGFPGNLELAVTYSLAEKNELQIIYRAFSDQDTLLNMTNHSYFNLNGQGNGDILDHKVQILAEYFTPLRGMNSIPTGEKRRVLSTPFDFTVPHRVGERIGLPDEQLIYGRGYNHNYVLAMNKGPFRTAARIFSEESGILMEVGTDLPGLQFYTGNQLEEERGKCGSIYGPHSGMALETGFFPNSINTRGFTPPVLRENIVWKSVTAFRFFVL